MPSCAYRNCRHTYDKHRSQFTFHRFPSQSSEELRKKWLINSGLDEDFDCSRSRICSAHFKPDDFERDLKGELLGEPLKKRLKDNAVPLINLSLVKDEPIDKCDTLIRSSLVLEQLAEVAVNRALDNSNFNSQTVSAYREPNIPVELVVEPVVSAVHHVPSTLPASQNWPGEFDFNITFSPQEKNTKGVSWTYSKTKDKLYVGKDSPCPINFSTNTVMPSTVKIRAMALYSSPESASEVVMRCVNHSLDEKSKKIFEAEHLVRCESAAAAYEVDASTKRHSVIVPFENAPAGQHFSTYIYKFTCFGSCPFGPNRRPLMLVFTLENGDQVIGRRKVDVKICACPGRDRKADEEQIHSATFEGGSSRKRKEPELMTLADALHFTKSVTIPRAKQAKVTPNQDGVYVLDVEDFECYEFLKQMKKFYEICKTMKSLPHDVRKAIVQYQQRKNIDLSSDG